VSQNKVKIKKLEEKKKSKNDEIQQIFKQKTDISTEIKILKNDLLKIGTDQDECPICLRVVTDGDLEHIDNRKKTIQKDIEEKSNITVDFSKKQNELESDVTLIDKAINLLKDGVNKNLLLEQQKKNDEEKRWVDVLYPVLLTYNVKLQHSATNMTPSEARKPINEIAVKTNLEMKKVRKRLYPDIEVGDYVRLYRKKDKLDKERKSLWSTEKYKVLEITESMRQKLYTIDKKDNGREPTYVRSELLLVS
jgi:hypothetical protein